MPDPAITLERINPDLKLYAGDSESFTCRVVIPTDVDTCVNVSQTWVREFHQQSEINVTIFVILNKTQKSFEEEIEVSNLTSQNWRVSCRSAVYPLEQGYILRSEERSQAVTLDITGDYLSNNSAVYHNKFSFIALYCDNIAGVFLRFNNSIFLNSSSVPVGDLKPIQCHSDNSEANGQPEWRFPNGTRVREDGVIVAIKQDGHVTLKQVDNSTSIPLGQYCCLAQDARGDSHTLCIDIIPGTIPPHTVW